MPQRKRAKTTAVAAKQSVTVRMYNQGFGDCFLITLQGDDGKPRYMLIDCGVHHQYPDRETKMQMVASDIAKKTGQHLDVVAITHEHTDHLYGFKYARDIFEKITVENLWLAWTENPDDTIAKELKQTVRKGVEELKASIGMLAPVNESFAFALQSLLDFEILPATGTTSELEYLRKHSLRSPRRPEDYLQPGGKPLTIPGVKGVNIYVLGPPRCVSDIKTLTRENEMYPEFAALQNMAPFLSALGIKSEVMQEENLRYRVSCPFAKSFEIDSKRASKNREYGRFFREFYGFSNTDPGQEWQRIDNDWLAPASELALNINNLTNNTSLVLALELTETEPHKVLLFAGDAQVGNWLSWQQVEFYLDEEKKKIVKGAELLNKTIVYKVGHHGSRNATLREKGLEMMDDTDLVAMLPVDEDWAKIKMRWEHPATNLLARLKEKSKNRVLRTDKIKDLPGDLNMPHGYSQNEWKSFLDRINWDKSPENLWVEYTV